jgi:hypothetical protein
MAFAEGAVAEGVHDQRASPAEAYYPEDLACQDDILAGVGGFLVLDRNLVAG